MLVKEYIARFLEERELTHCFGLSGANVEDLFFEINSRNKIKMILAKTEYSASMMAIGHYMTSKKVSVIMTTSGAGLLNTVPVLAEAYSSDLPFVLISGLIPQALEGKRSFQDGSGKGKSLNVFDVVRPVTGFIHIVKSADEIPEVLASAFFSAETTKKPSAIFIPKNIFLEKIKITEVEVKKAGKVIQDDKKINAFIQAFKEFTESPLVILGEKLIHLKSLEGLNDLLSKINAKIGVTPNGKGFYDHRAVDFLGMTGVMGSNKLFEYAKEAKNIILIGTEFDMLSRFDLEPSLKNKNIFVLNETLTDVSSFIETNEFSEVNGDLEEMLSFIAQNIPTSKNKDILNLFEENATKDFSFRSIVHQFSEVIEKNANILADAGNTGAFIVHDLKLSGKNLFYVSLGMGGMGNSIGASIGCSIGNNLRSYAFMGDGSFLMYGLELHTAVEYNLPVTFVIFNNNSHGMCTTRENVFLGNETGINDFQKSFFGRGIDQVFPGLATFDISNITELDSCLKLLPLIKTPCLISLNISRDEEPPFRSFYKK